MGERGQPGDGNDSRKAGGTREGPWCVPTAWGAGTLGGTWYHRGLIWWELQP